MGDLSKDFSTDEFRCHGKNCCDHKFMADPALIRGLQDLREAVHGPIIVLCGYRCPKHNAEIGGTIGSQHMVGRAADINIPGFTVEQMALLAESIHVFNGGGIGRYPHKNFVHVDVRPNGPARWTE